MWLDLADLSNQINKALQLGCAAVCRRRGSQEGLHGPVNIFHSFLELVTLRGEMLFQFARRIRKLRQECSNRTRWFGLHGFPLVDSGDNSHSRTQKNCHAGYACAGEVIRNVQTRAKVDALRQTKLVKRLKYALAISCSRCRLAVIEENSERISTQAFNRIVYPTDLLGDIGTYARVAILPICAGHTVRY